MQRIRYLYVLLALFTAHCTAGDPPVRPADGRVEGGKKDLKTTGDQKVENKGSCLPPRKICDEQCVDTTRNMSHCGACKNNCAANLGARIDSCSGGLCVCAAESGVPCLEQQFCTTSGCEKECPPSQQCGIACCVVTDSCIDGNCCPEARACDGTCCESNQACTGGICCPAVQACGDTCCSSGESCVDGNCCPAASLCSSACCGSDQSCIDDVCCDAARSCGSVCCDAAETCVEDSCCDNDQVCNGACCDAAETCIDDTCCPADQACNGSCCTTAETCIGGSCCAAGGQCGSECCAGDESCISESCCPTDQVCNGACCDAGAMCIEGSCCAEGKACGSSCCGASEFCFDWICSLPTAGITAIYTTTQRYDGDLGGRSGADAKCAADKPANITCQTIAALLSVDINDELQDLTGPPHSLVASQPVYFYDRLSHHFTPCASTWTQALDTGTTPLKYNVTQGTGKGFNDENYWTGSTSTGGYAGSGTWDYTCNGWTTTSTTVSTLGTQGDPNSLLAWLHSSQNYLTCTRELYLLCACKL